MQYFIIDYILYVLIIGLKTYLYYILTMSGMTQPNNILKSRFNKLVVGDAWDINNTNNTKMNIEVIARNTSSITITTRLYFYEDNTRITLPPNKLNRKNYNELFGNAEHESLYFFPANN
mgnify:CR=1 FL=1